MQALELLLLTLLPSPCNPLTAVRRLFIKLADLTAEGGSAGSFNMVRIKTLACCRFARDHLASLVRAILLHLYVSQS